MKVLEKRYLKKDEEGNPVETPVEMFRRAARTIASADLLHNPGLILTPWKKSFTG